MGDLDIHDQPVAVLHEDVPHVAQARFVAPALLNRRASASVVLAWVVVAALLSFEVHLGIAPLSRGLVVVPALETFVRGPGPISVPSTLKCSSLLNPRPIGGVLDPSKRRRARSSLKSRRGWR